MSSLYSNVFFDAYARGNFPKKRFYENCLRLSGKVFLESSLNLSCIFQVYIFNSKRIKSNIILAFICYFYRIYPLPKKNFNKIWKIHQKTKISVSETHIQYFSAFLTGLGFPTEIGLCESSGRDCWRCSLSSFLPCGFSLLSPFTLSSSSRAIMTKCPFRKR